MNTDKKPPVIRPEVFCRLLRGNVEYMSKYVDFNKIIKYLSK